MDLFLEARAVAAALLPLPLLLLLGVILDAKEAVGW